MEGYLWESFISFKYAMITLKRYDRRYPILRIESLVEGEGQHKFWLVTFWPNGSETSFDASHRLTFCYCWFVHNFLKAGKDQDVSRRGLQHSEGLQIFKISTDNYRYLPSFQFGCRQNDLFPFLHFLRLLHVWTLSDLGHDLKSNPFYLQLLLAYSPLFDPRTSMQNMRTNRRNGEKDKWKGERAGRVKERTREEC